jgi:hypothetical protein
MSSSQGQNIVSYDGLVETHHERTIMSEHAAHTHGDAIMDPVPEHEGLRPYVPEHGAGVMIESDITIPSLAGLSQKRSQAFIDFFSEWLRMSPLRRDIIARRISDPSITNKEIADELGVTDQHVGGTVNQIATAGKLIPVGSMRMPRNKKRKAATENTAAA